MLAKTFEVSKVESEEDLQAVGAFRYQCYLDEGLIAPQADETFLDQYDFAPSANIFTIKSCGRIVGTIRLHILTKDSHSSATMTAFPDILMPKVSAGMTLIDGARFSVAPDLGSMRLPVARRTLRLYAKFAEKHAVDFGVASVRESHVKFYKRLWGFDQIAEPRPYGGLTEKLVLLGVDLRHDRQSNQEVA
ncbi:N-acyl amino acid synthase FeeM domain-containing protein [Marivita hallyeonensis]|uniref:N-acyl-L-homoserine lactone synthetase n=1 Tax=Marivita hallyeonensis TaxID=996342 RepID=A0A1M5MR95_9RHOB|nr:acyl-homoserine-lactone synthase [Marivita hallyeonensis]SHG79582.1 N-acyl-L-homoserine lactone synthetase [Marivita hallyeonensis]